MSTTLLLYLKMRWEIHNILLILHTFLVFFFFLQRIKYVIKNNWPVYVKSFIGMFLLNLLKVREKWSYCQLKIMALVFFFFFFWDFYISLYSTNTALYLLTMSSNQKASYNHKTNFFLSQRYFILGKLFFFSIFPKILKIWLWLYLFFVFFFFFSMPIMY